MSDKKIKILGNGAYRVQGVLARTTVQAGLPPGMLIEVDCITLVPETK